MAELILSAVLPIVFEKLVSVVANKFADRSKEIQSELKKWNASLVQISKLLRDAAEKEIKDESVKHWLIRLRHLAYDIDDELDALATDAAIMHSDDQEPPKNITTKVKKLIPTCCTASSSSSSSSPSPSSHYKKLTDITTQLQELYDEKVNLGLTVKGKSLSKNKKERPYEASLLTPGIVGRDAEKNTLLQKLVPDHDEPMVSRHNFSIVPIVGMGGMGKTTLARLLYNEPKVNQHFELKAWVCVSDEFADSFKISKLIYESVGGQEKFENQDMLQQALNNKLSGRRFLLVLDDLWSENIQEWDRIVPPFYEVAPGSKIIITTRTDNLIQQLGCDDPFYLNKLSDGDALSLLAQHALGEDNFDSSPKLKPHGQGIVRKCGALPLALKSLGSLLRSKQRNEEKWKEMLESEIWSSQDDTRILPALRLSYLDLSARLKHLFAYSCLFPKDYVFEKEDLILLWMAEGFLLGSKSSKSMECLGEEYFDELLSRSFFQHVPDDESLFVMHDLMNDLAASVAGEFFIRLDVEMKNNIEEHSLKKYRHMSFVREGFMSHKKFKAIEKANALRTFLAVPIDMRDEGWKRFYPSRKILVDLLPRMPLLRALCLSKLEIDEIPESVGDLKHLRYLNVSRTPITHLPDSVCNLYNLQTLIVFGCGNLKELPDNFMKLRNLRHFDVRDTPLLMNMSLGVGEMKILQTLSKISIGEENKFPTSGLRNLKNLHRKVCIDGLDKLQNIDQAQKLNLPQMKVSELVMEWSDEFDGSRKQRLETEVQVLDVLKPRSDNLKNLVIESYGGTKFPKWVGDSSFCKLNVVYISKCRNCLFLPPLGQLPSLKKLFIDSMDDVKEVGSGLSGNESPAFPSLKILSFFNMPRWEEWSVNAVGVAVFPRLEELRIRNCPNMERWEVNADVRVFPCLQELTVTRCPNLVKVSLEALPSLRVLTIDQCGDGVLKSLVGVASSVTKLNIYVISGLSDEVWAGVVQYLGVLEELEINCCHEIRNLWESEEATDACKEVLVNLKKLTIKWCHELVRIGGGRGEERSNLPTSLRMLEITSCKNLKHLSCPDNIETLTLYSCENLKHLSCPANNTIQMLSINDCKSITSASFPIGGWGWQKFKSLEVLSTTSMGPENLISMTKATCFLQQLMRLEIEDCGGIESFPDLKDLVSLKQLEIRDCASMDGPPLVGSGVWPPNLDSLVIGKLKRPISEWGPLPTSLVKLELWGGFYGSSAEGEEEDVKSFPTSSSLLPYSLSSSLTKLQLFYFNKMERISSEGLQHLTSLQHLSIRFCPMLKHLPETLLLPTLLSLELVDCNEELKEKMMSRRGSYWPRLSDIPKVNIY